MKIDSVIRCISDSTGDNLILKKSLKAIKDNPISAYQTYVLELYKIEDKPHLILKREYTDKFVRASEEIVKEKYQLQFLKDIFNYYADRYK